jgi:hypothetical protein
MLIVYAGESAPESFSKSVFLAGPTPRSAEVPSWRPQAIELFEAAGFDGVIFTPESRGGLWRSNYLDQVEWEEKHLHMADCILFWVPRDLTTMPALTTNTEWGVWYDSGKAVFGAPPEAAKVRYQKYYADKLQLPLLDTLADTVSGAVAHIGAGALRHGGETAVPLHIWQTERFQCWHQEQVALGQQLVDARVVWQYRPRPGSKEAAYWALHATMVNAVDNSRQSDAMVLSCPADMPISILPPGEAG